MEKTSPDHPSPTGTGLLMALSNVTWVSLGKRREKRSPQDGDNHFFLQGSFFFQEDAMLFHEIPLLDDVLILVIV
jgi:hypothetical protein